MKMHYMSQFWHCKHFSEKQTFEKKQVEFDGKLMY